MMSGYVNEELSAKRNDLLWTMSLLSPSDWFYFNCVDN